MQETRLDRINDDIVLEQSRDGLLFTTDAYLLSAFVRRADPGARFGRAAELGAGTGVVSLLLAARRRAERIFSVEVQPELFRVMERNIKNNSLGDVITPVLADVRELGESMPGGTFDAVFSNPPYLAAGSGKPSAHAAADISRREIYGGIGDFCSAAGRLCRSGGTFFVVYRPERISELFFCLRTAGFEPKTLTLLYPDPDSPPSLLFCAARRGGKPGGLRVTRPLFVYGRGGREETEDFRRIYETGLFPDDFSVR